MATVQKFLPKPHRFYAELQDRTNLAEGQRHKRFVAVLLLQRMARGYLIRKHITWLSRNALIIQRAFRMHRARTVYRAALRRAVRLKHARHYNVASTRIQVLTVITFKKKLGIYNFSTFSTDNRFCNSRPFGGDTIQDELSFAIDRIAVGWLLLQNAERGEQLKPRSSALGAELMT